MNPKAIAVWCMGMAFAIAETVHFGNNLTPHSDAEMICDGIAVLIMALSLLVPSEKKS